MFKLSVFVSSLGEVFLSESIGRLEGTILTFPYPCIPFYGLAGYDSGVSLPSHTVFRFGRVRFRRLLTLAHRFSVWQGTIQTVAYPTISFFSFRGYGNHRLQTLPAKKTAPNPGLLHVSQTSAWTGHLPKPGLINHHSVFSCSLRLLFWTLLCSGFSFCVR